MRPSDPSGTSTSDTVVELTSVWKTYRQRQRAEKLGDAVTHLFHPKVRTIDALKGVGLTIGRGEILAYAGPNGAGKSTTIKMLSGLLKPTRGEVRVFGMDPIRHRVDFVRRIGVVFGQRTDMWWDHPISASYDWKRVVWDIPRKDYDRMVSFVKELLGIGEFFDTTARELSLGQRMRADLGFALLHEPEILFLDEPTLGLDVLAKRNVMQSILDLNRERHLTVLVTSHDMRDLEQLASRVVMVHKGQIAFDGAFSALRKTLGDRRSLVLITSDGPAPVLDGTELVSSESGRHEYSFDATHVAIADLLASAGAQTEVLDMEVTRGAIDDVVADIYNEWLTTHPAV